MAQHNRQRLRNVARYGRHGNRQATRLPRATRHNIDKLPAPWSGRALVLVVSPRSEVGCTAQGTIVSSSSSCDHTWVGRSCGILSVDR